MLSQKERVLRAKRLIFVPDRMNGTKNLKTERLDVTFSKGRIDTLISNKRRN